MSNLTLLAIAFFIMFIGCVGMSKRIDKLEENLDYLRKYVNMKFKELETNEDRNTNVVPFKKEQSENSNKS